ncbi:MAG: hypothetical protein ACJAWL_001135 [Motiliproteus sp.]|jgi:hypothetical protein
MAGVPHSFPVHASNIQNKAWQLSFVMVDNDKESTEDHVWQVSEVSRL